MQLQKFQNGSAAKLLYLDERTLGMGHIVKGGWSAFKIYNFAQEADHVNFLLPNSPALKNLGFLVEEISRQYRFPRLVGVFVQYGKGKDVENTAFAWNYNEGNKAIFAQLHASPNVEKDREVKIGIFDTYALPILAHETAVRVLHRPQPLDIEPNRENYLNDFYDGRNISSPLNRKIQSGDIQPRLFNRLEKLGVTTFEELFALSNDDLSSIGGIGKTTIREMRRLQREMKGVDTAKTLLAEHLR